MKNNKTVYVSCFGCPLLRQDVWRVLSLAKQNGCVQVNDVEVADYVVLAGCGVINLEKNASLRKISAIINRAKRTAVKVIYGCISSVAEEVLQEYGDLIIIKRNEEDRFDEIFCGVQKIKNITSHYYNNESYGEILTFDAYKPLSQEKEKQKRLCCDLDKIHKTNLFMEAFEFCTRFPSYSAGGEDVFEIRIGFGCAGNCTYCLEKKINGSLKSINSDIIIEQIKTGINQGYKKFYLLSPDSGHWGMDIEDDICSLLDRIANIANETNIKIKINLPCLHPDKLVTSYERLLPHFQSGLIYSTTISIETGSRRIMKLMNRKTDIEKFRAVMQDIYAKQVPTYFYTEVIIGFPGETMEDIALTMQLLQDTHFDFVSANPYSRQDGTVAATFTNQVPQKEIERRWAIMRQYLNILRSHQLLHRIVSILASIK